MNPLDAYAQAVVSGALPTGKYHRLACERHLHDRKREGTPDFPYRLDMDRVNRLVRFAEKLKHYKGAWAGTFIHLEPWEVFILGSLIGWVHCETGLRRFRTAFHEVPRKNGKTLIAAIILLYLAFFDGEQGAEGYCIALKRDQAKLVFNDARKLVISSGLKRRLRVQVATLYRDDVNAKAQPLGADHDSTDGLNPCVVIVDEMHAMKDRGMLDVMETATGARAQPVIYIITTFGNDPVLPWGEQHDYATKILERVLVDESFFVFTAHADPEDDWSLPETARKANPNYGISVNPDDLAAKVLKAKGIPSAAATYKQKHLNILVTSSNPCLSVDGWRRGQNPEHLTREGWLQRLSHQVCYAGIDLASLLDLCSLSLVFPPTMDRAWWCVLQYILTADDTLSDRAHRDRAPYGVWRDQRWLDTNAGVRIDHQLLRPKLREARERYDLHTIGFDPYHADTLIEQLTHEDGFAETAVVAVPQTIPSMAVACVRMQAEIADAKVDACGCPVTAWAVSNVVPSNPQDNKGNLMFSKGKSRGRIDPVISATIGLALWLRQPAEAKTPTMLVFGR
ncbi:MAG TPA: terminase large subunit [Phycisphaerae bacterium]|nr:terminase large subunit [Phycisphaerae bacterium]